LANNIEEKIIKPPIKKVTSGKIFKPSKAFLQKRLTQIIASVLIFWLIIVVGFVGVIFIGSVAEPADVPDPILAISTWIGPVSFWGMLLNTLWAIPLLVYTPFYIRSIEYSVKAESGETMPEVYTQHGVLTITRKHVPFRTVTNISSKAGLFDRFFEIGSVHIETAGYSGNQKQGPEVKLEGIVFYEEVRDFILNELRKFKTTYTTGTEIPLNKDEPVPRQPGLDEEILLTLREIRDHIKKQKTNG
jgi:membrane protein YdbS with pleckstrin-like domain